MPLKNEIGNKYEKLYKTQQHDIFKNNYCKQNNINLLRISYRDDYKEKITNCLNFL